VIRIIEFKDLEMDYDAVSGMTVTLSTDQPGNAMGVRKTLSYPSSSGRRVHTLPVDGASGNLYSVKATSTGVTKLYAGVLRGRAIGVYFDGANGEFFETQPQAA
jgi:hypothetical protein